MIPIRDTNNKLKKRHNLDRSQYQVYHTNNLEYYTYRCSLFCYVKSENADSKDFGQQGLTN